jgi:hypothetical protein
MEQIALDKRPCILGVSLNTPTQKHGDERVPAKGIRVKNILLTKEELNTFFDDKHAWDMLYVEHKGKPAEPFWTGKLGSLPVPGKWKGSVGTIHFGVHDYHVTFVEAVISKVLLEPQTGGLTAMSITLLALKARISGELARLDEYLGKNVSIALEFGDPDEEDSDEESDVDEEQESLDLTPGGKVDATEDEKPARRRRRPSDGATVN